MFLKTFAVLYSVIILMDCLMWFGPELIELAKNATLPFVIALCQVLSLQALFAALITLLFYKVVKW